MPIVIETEQGYRIVDPVRGLVGEGYGVRSRADYDADYLREVAAW